MYLHKTIIALTEELCVELAMKRQKLMQEELHNH